MRKLQPVYMTAEEKAVIKNAADREGRAISQFMVFHALQRAKFEHGLALGDNKDD